MTTALLLGVLLASPAGPVELASALASAERELAAVLPDTPWAQICRVDWSRSDSAADRAAADVVEPCEAGTELAADFDPMVTYARIFGDGDRVSATLRTTGVRGCWKPTASTRAHFRKKGLPVPDASLLMYGHRGGAVLMVRRSAESLMWFRRFVRAAGRSAGRFEQVGASEHGPVFVGRLDDGQRATLTLDGGARLRWLEVGDDRSGFRIELTPVDGALLPDAMRIHRGGDTVWLKWRSQRAPHGWALTSLSFGPTRRDEATVALAECQPEDDGSRAAFDAAQPLQD